MEGSTALLRIPPPTKPYLLPSSLSLATTKPYRGFSLLVRAAPPPDSENQLGSNDASVSAPAPPTPLKKPSGFGGATDEKKNRKSKERSSVIRRAPIEPLYSASGEGRSQREEERGTNEAAFLIAWLGLGSLILVEGVVLAASGLLPEEWDNFLVKYLYPSFTPTVFVFVCGTAAYGVFKYLQGDQLKS